MSNDLKKFVPLLKVIQVATKRVRKIILDDADNEVIKVICEICYNFCKGNLKTNKKCYKKLLKYKTQIHTLAKTRKSQKNLKTERKVLQQSGAGFIPLLLSPLLSLLS